MAVRSRIVSRAIAGDRRALDALWAEHREWMGAMVLAHLPREADAEDVLQEVALAVVRGIHTLRDPDALHGWLREVARRTAQTHGRRAAVRRRARRDGRRHLGPGRGPGPLRRPLVRRRDRKRTVRLLGEVRGTAPRRGVVSAEARQKINEAEHLAGWRAWPAGKSA